MDEIVSYITSSQTRIFPDTCIAPECLSASMCLNESLSFTLAFRSVDKECIPVSVSANCPGLDISVYKVGYVPVTHASSVYDEVATEGRGPGMYPDILYPRSANPRIVKRNDSRLPYYEAEETNLLNATCDSFQSLLICVNEEGKITDSGKHEIKIAITSLESKDVLAEHVFTVDVIECELPETDLMYTNWMHYDCIADIHGIRLYSDKYFNVLESYIKEAVLNGMNTLLLPMFTPPLDTFIGGERKDVQLLGIEVKDGKYKFDFTLAKRFVTLALRCGIKYFEHSHLFTQWGAEHAPNIYAGTDDGKKQIFGWDTEASGKDYREFLESYISNFNEFAKEMKIEDKMFYHISDEPTPENSLTYGKAVDTVSGLLKDKKSGDALSDLCFYDNGYVKTPIVAVAHADNFYGKCKEMWLYYTCGYYGDHGFEKCTNRLITSKPYRTSILGLHLYRYKATGFLHWGYNYYYDRMSRGLFDPKNDPCGYKNYPGASYIVYPGVECALSSLRSKYMCEAIMDLRVLKALEQKIGYDKVIDICEDYFGHPIDAHTIPESAEKMLGFKKLIREELKKQNKVL